MVKQFGKVMVLYVIVLTLVLIVACERKRPESTYWEPKVWHDNIHGITCYYYANFACATDGVKPLPPNE